MKDNILVTKSYSFALRIVKLYKFLTEEKKEFVISKQILRSGTSIGANVEEALGWVSKKDFIAKLSVSYREARETIFWLKLLRDSEYLTEIQVGELLQECEELCKIIGKIQITSKKRNSHL